MHGGLRPSDAGRVSDHTIQSLLTRHEKTLTEYLRQRIPAHLRGTLEPEDLLQEIRAAAWNRRDTFRSVHPSSFDRWIRAITDRKLLDLRKWAHRARRGGHGAHRAINFGSADSVVAPQLATGTKTPSRVAATREALGELHSALARLPDDLRRAFLLCEIEGQSLEQAAIAMGRTPAAVRSMLYRGRAKLRALLGDPGRLFSDSGVTVAEGRAKPTLPHDRH